MCNDLCVLNKPHLLVLLLRSSKWLLIFLLAFSIATVICILVNFCLYVLGHHITDAMTFYSYEVWFSVSLVIPLYCNTFSLILKWLYQLSFSLVFCISFFIPLTLLFAFYKRFYLFIFRERRREGEREGKKHQCVVAFQVPHTGDLAHNPGMCPDWGSNQWPFGSHASAQSTEPR